MVVSVHAIFSKNSKIGSKLIACGTKHLASNRTPVSHTALLINERWVHESTGKGVKVRSYDVWITEHQEVARVQLIDQEYQEVADHFRAIQDKKYDIPGVMYLAICIALNLIGKPIPKVNKWQSKNKYFCCEVLGYLTNEDYSMAAPIQILDKLS
jgi:hypothetical protein